MSSINRHTSRLASATIMLVAACLLMPTVSAHAAGATHTNSVPYAQDFEAWTSGSSIIGTFPYAWSAADTNYATLVVTNNSATSYALPDSSHSQVVALSTDGAYVTNDLSGSDNSDPNYWVDMNIQMVVSDSAPTSITNDTEIQTAIYLNGDGHLVVYHSMPDDTNSWSSASNNYWTVLSNTAIEDGSWHRLTVAMDYDPAAFDGSGLKYEFFKVILDGQTLSSPTTAWDLENLSPGDAPGGEWFLTANSNPSDDRQLTGALFSGTGYFDDFVVTNGEPDQATFYTNGVPGWWLSQYSLAQDNSSTGALDNADNDAYVAWQEWLLGTSPGESNAFQLMVESTGGTNYIKWVADSMMDPNAGGNILLKKSTDLLAGYTSTQTVSRTTMTAGTNVWTDTGSSNAMYRLSVQKD